MVVVVAASGRVVVVDVDARSVVVVMSSPAPIRAVVVRCSWPGRTGGQRQDPCDHQDAGLRKSPFAHHQNDNAPIAESGSSEANGALTAPAESGEVDGTHPPAPSAPTLTRATCHEGEEPRAQRRNRTTILPTVNAPGRLRTPKVVRRRSGTVATAAAKRSR